MNSVKISVRCRGKKYSMAEWEEYLKKAVNEMEVNAYLDMAEEARMVITVNDGEGVMQGMSVLWGRN